MTLRDSKILGRLGMNYVERIALSVGCKLIPVPEDLDTGIDGFIEFGLSDGDTRLVAVQVKRGDSYFDGRTGKCQVDQRHMHYWVQYPLPVILILIRDDESEAFWMDARLYIRRTPDVLAQRSTVLRPPANQRFDTSSLKTQIIALASTATFGDAVTALTDDVEETRLSALSLLYRFRAERRTPFCLAAALRVEDDASVMARFADFYSRYLPHPEYPFGVDSRVSFYAKSLLADFSRHHLLALLTAFTADGDSDDWDGATEIFRMADQEIWHRYDIVERGTVQQGIAELVRVVAPASVLLSVIEDSKVSLQQRKSGLALFGYLGYTCEAQRLDEVASSESDGPFLALVKWLRHWIVEEADAGENGL